MNYYPFNFSELSSYSQNTGMVRMLLTINMKDPNMRHQCP